MPTRNYTTPDQYSTAQRSTVERAQDQSKKEIHKVAVDYADKLGVAKAQGEYIDMRYVFEGYRHWILAHR